MWTRTLSRLSLILGVCLTGCIFLKSALAAQIQGATPAQLASCRSATESWYPMLNWSQMTVYPALTYQGGYVVIWWSEPNGLSGSCLVDDGGWLVSFDVRSAPYQRGVMQGATSVQIEACRVEAGNKLPGLTWRQLLIDPVGYRQNGNTVVLWRGPSGIPSGTCIVDDGGLIRQFNVN